MSNDLWQRQLLNYQKNEYIMTNIYSLHTEKNKPFEKNIPHVTTLLQRLLLSFVMKLGRNSA